MSVQANTASNGATLLVVDDDARARRALSQTFEQDGHSVIEVADAPAALRKLHQERCDLVMLDIELPGVGGLALCRLLRAQEATRRLPIIIISAHDTEEHKVGAFAAGANAFVVKPSTPRELLLRVKAHLDASRRERALEGINRELGFLADLGRGLLCALEPLQVVRRVAGATYEGANAALCAAVLMDERRETASRMAVKGRRAGDATATAGRHDAGVFSTARAAPRARLSSTPNVSRRGLRPRPRLRCDSLTAQSFSCATCATRSSISRRIRFDSRAFGALVVAFDRAEQCDETEESPRRCRRAAGRACRAHLLAVSCGARLVGDAR